MRPDKRERARFLRTACAGNHALLHEVEDLLGFEDEEGGQPNTQPEQEIRSKPISPFLQPNQRIGPYRVIDLLGAGGMGAVARVHDSTLDRHVALKVLRPDRVTPQLLARFERERRILARLNHPHIAQVFDAGTEEGMPWFTMELVDGEPLDLYCDRRRLSIEKRLRLVIAVCDALDEAHRNLVVHRDLKPSNLLITKAGEPKLLDFGIAKELDQLDGSDLTRTGNLPLTPSHASPEQVRGQPVGVGSDVYSLGVVLYRLLCGHPPYVLEGDSFEDLRKVCETVAPEPSTRAMVCLDVWDDGIPKRVMPNAIAFARGVTPPALRRSLSGALDAIVGKALAKVPRDRYRSIEGLGSDLRRHLDGRVVTAMAGSTQYRIGKLAVRHRRSFLALGLMLAAVLTGTTIWRTSRAADLRAREAVQQADALTLFARNLVRATDPDVTGGQLMKPQDLLTHGQAQARRMLKGQPEPLAHQLEAIGLAYQSLGELGSAIRLLEESLVLRRAVYRGDHRLVSRGLNNVAAAMQAAGRRAEAEPLFREALAMKRRLGYSSYDLTTVESNLASLLSFRGELAEAETRYRKVLAVRRTFQPPNRPYIARTLRALGNTLYLRGSLPEAEASIREALEIFVETQGRNSVLVAATLSSLGRVLHAQTRFDEAETAFVEVLETRKVLLGREHLHVALTQLDLASLYSDIGEVEIADLVWTRARQVLDLHLPKGSWELAAADSLLGARLATRGDRAAAENCLEQGFETLRRVRGVSAIMTQRAWARWDATREKPL